MSFLGRIIKWGLLALIAAGGLWFLWLLAWVLYWGSFNPGTTRFMAIRLAELREKNPDARLQQQWVAYNRISPHLKRALIAA